MYNVQIISFWTDGIKFEIHTEMVGNSSSSLTKYSYEFKEFWAELWSFRLGSRFYYELYSEIVPRISASNLRKLNVKCYSFDQRTYAKFQSPLTSGISFWNSSISIALWNFISSTGGRNTEKSKLLIDYMRLSGRNNYGKPKQCRW